MTRITLWFLALSIAIAGMFAPLHAEEAPPAPFGGLAWRLVGPFRGGRVIAVAGIPGNARVFYFGGVAGGVWKTIDGGQNWTPIFDHQPVSSIGSIAVAESDPNTVYVGTGEGCIRGIASFGNGVYKSLDGGKTWAHIGLDNTRQIGKLIVNPTNPNVVFVAALGHANGPKAERGVFRSLDGGKTWGKVLYQDDKTGAIDVTFDPHNPHVLFAALWQVYRTPYSLVSGGPGSGLYKSIDGGTTWKHIEGHGLPQGVLGRLGVSVSGADGNRVYAMIEANQGGLYRSSDGGLTWQYVSADHRIRQRPWYFSHIVADPKSVDTVYVLNTGLFRSTDGGKSFDQLRVPHGDVHGLWVDPTNPERMISGNDGGATISQDDGKSWTTEFNQPTGQFYHVSVDNRFPYYLYGAQQDNTTVAIPSSSEMGYIDRSSWYPVGGGESGWIAPYLPNPNIVFASAYQSHGGGTVSRYDRTTGQTQEITPWPISPMGHGAADGKHRFQWTAPLVSSPNDPNVLYFGGEVLFKTSDQGKSWSTISPDLTRNDKTKQQSSGGPITQEAFDLLNGILETQLAQWRDAVSKDLPELEQLIHKNDLPAISIPLLGNRVASVPVLLLQRKIAGGTRLGGADEAQPWEYQKEASLA